MKQENLMSRKKGLIWEGMLIGIFSGGMAAFYRWLLGVCDEERRTLLSFFGQNIWRMLLWMVILIGIVWIVSVLCRKEPMISGSGIPQIEGEFHGKLKANPIRVIAMKLLGGSLSILGGLSLGREGPSVQIGGMGGAFLSDRFRREGEEKQFLLLCGAAAGLSAAFNAPLAGILFAVEEIYKSVSPPFLFSVMISSVAADYLSKICFGTGTVFAFPLLAQIPLQDYWLLLLLGIIVGVFGTVYNKTLLFTKKQYDKIRHPFVRVLIPFLVAGILGFTLPQVLGGGHRMVEMLTQPGWMVSSIAVLLLVKFLFSMLSFGSGAPGGIFFPLLVLGAYIGAIYAQIAIGFWGVDGAALYSLIVMAMAGYFTSIVHAPITGIVLLCEMTGSFQNLLPISFVCTVSYLVTNLMKNQPIYDSLLERILNQE